MMMLSMQTETTYFAIFIVYFIFRMILRHLGTTHEKILLATSDAFAAMFPNVQYPS